MESILLSLINSSHSTISEPQSDATSSTKYSVIDCDTGSSTGVSQYRYTGSNYTALFENIIFNYTTVNGVISSDSELFDFGNYNCKVKFKNCQFNFNTYRLMTIVSGSLEFENCSFYFDRGNTDTVCARIVDHISSSMSYPLNISFKNCKIDSSIQLDVYLFTIQGYSTDHDSTYIIQDCDITNTAVFEVDSVEYDNYTRHIHIINNNINRIYEIGKSVQSYTDGDFIFQGNTVTTNNVDPVNINITTPSTVISNNIFYDDVYVNYKQGETNQNIFSNNIVQGLCSLKGAGAFHSNLTSVSSLTAVGNSCSDISSSGFGKTNQAYND